MKKPTGRYIVHVTETNVDFLGFAVKGDKKATARFEAGMLAVYGIELQGYD